MEEQVAERQVSILDKAQKLVYGARQEAYGHPFNDFSRTAKMWEAIFGHLVTPEQVAMCLICVKISRECNASKEDNRIDMAGYAATLDLVAQWRKGNAQFAGQASRPPADAPNKPYRGVEYP